MTAFPPLSTGRTLSIMPTFQCTAACKSCGTLSSPRDATWLRPELMFSAIDQAADNGYSVVVFTGGEATLAGDQLIDGIRHAVQLGLSVRLVTNAWWASDIENARQSVANYREAGLSEINFSTGDQHRRFVPIENVIHATEAAIEHGLPVGIMIEVINSRTTMKETVQNHPEYIRLSREFPNAQVVIHESPWMPLSPMRTYSYPEGLAANRNNLAVRTGCDSVLGTTTIQADGRIGACCGLGMRLIPELQIGTIEETSLEDADKRAADDFLKRWIRVEGPERILAWAAEIDQNIEWEDMYAHRCQACLRLYKDPKVRHVILQHHHEKLADVLFGEWLLFGYAGC